MSRKRRLNLPPRRERQKKAIERRFRAKGMPLPEARTRAIKITRAQMKRARRKRIR